MINRHHRDEDGEHHNRTGTPWDRQDHRNRNVTAKSPPTLIMLIASAPSQLTGLPFEVRSASEQLAPSRRMTEELPETATAAATPRQPAHHDRRVCSLRRSSVIDAQPRRLSRHTYTRRRPRGLPTLPRSSRSSRLGYLRWPTAGAVGSQAGDDRHGGVRRNPHHRGGSVVIVPSNGPDSARDASAPTSPPRRHGSVASLVVC